ncbi:MAG: hypothetical protein AB7G12_06050 [Thermoanaerobaculia bacterium]
MRHQAIGALFVFVAFGFASGSSAQNLLSNPAFDVGQGTDGWIVETGSVQLVADQAHCTTSQALEGTSGVSGGGNQFFFFETIGCIAIDSAVHPTIFLGGDYRTTANVYSRIYLTLFNDSGCQGGASFTPTVAGPSSPIWTRILGEVNLPNGVQGVRFSVDNIIAQIGEPQFTVEWDRLYLGFDGEIYSDSFEFESGSNCRWSSATGAI